MDPIKVKIPVGEDINITPVEKVETAEETAAKLAKEQADKDAAEKAIADKAKADKDAADAAAAAAASSDSNKKSKIAILDESGTSIEYSLNDKGDAIDDKGAIVYSASQLAEFENETDEPNVASIEDISKLSGIQILDESGKPKSYENTVDGFAQREVDIKRIGYEEGTEKALESFFKANPDLESMYKYKYTYGTLDNYSEFVDYSKITIDKTNEQQMLDIVVKAELAKGASKERALKYANFSKADGTLAADADDSLKFLASSQEKDKQVAEKRNKEAAEAEMQKEFQYYGIGYDKDNKPVVLNVEGSVYDMVVSKGVIGNIMLPKDGITVKTPEGTAKHLSRQQVFDYIYTPIAEIEGELYSQAQIDEYKRLSSKEELVATYVRNLLGGDVSQLVEISKRKDNANIIRTIKLKSKESSRSNSSGGTKKVVIPIN